MITDLWQDLSYAARSLRKRPFLSIAIIATLTAGIGISTGVFTYYDSQYLRPRVDKDFDSFLRVYSAYTVDPLRPPGIPGDATLDDYLAFRDQAKSLRNLAAYADFRAPIGDEDPVDVRTLLVTSNFFSVYDLDHPLMGRLLQPEDCSAANPVVVLSDRLWHDRFASDPEIVGRVVLFNGRPVTVVGVTPTFAGMVNNARAWFPYTIESYLKRSDNLRQTAKDAWLKIAGRLSPGFSQRDAATELSLIASQQDRLHPGRISNVVVTDGSSIREPGNTLFWGITLIVAALVFLVLIVCLNVATLLLSRAAARRQEITVRLALGAGRMRLVRMRLAETFLLASIAGLASLYIAYRCLMF